MFKLLMILCVICILEEGGAVPAYTASVSPLNIATATDQSDVGQEPPEDGASVDVPNSQGLNPTHVAAVNSHHDIMGLLLQNGSDINARTPDGSTALHKVAAEGDKQMVKFIIDAENASVSVRNNNMETPLLLAERGGHTEVAKLLTEKIGELTSSLIEAAMNDKLDDAKLLVLRGADVEGRNSEGFTPLSWAARHGYLNVVKYLAEEGGAELEPRDMHVVTPLLAAAYNGYLPTVEYVVGRGAELETRSNSGVTPLMWAAYNGHLDTVEYLVGRGANVDAKDNFGRALLSWAAEKGGLNIVKYLVEQGAFIDVPNSQGLIPAHVAAVNSHQDILGLLLKNGGDINARTLNGSTALHLAAAKGDKHMVNFIMHTGNASVSVRNNNMETPLKLAELGGHIEVAKLLSKKIGELTSNLIEAANNDELDDAKLLVLRGADVEGRESTYEKTPLSMAAEQGHLKVVKYLVEDGVADLETRSNNGVTPLMLAAMGGDLDTVEYLVVRGAKLETRDSAGYTPLSWAAEKGRLNVVKFLLEHGASIDVPNFQGLNPTHIAAVNCHQDIMGLLLQNGSDINARTFNGSTALHLVAAKGDKQTVNFIIHTGNARVNVRNNNMETPLKLAERGGHTAVAKLLSEEIGELTSSLIEAAMNDKLDDAKSLVLRGADVEGGDGTHKTPLSSAAEHGNLNMVKYLVEDEGVNLESTSENNYTPLIYAAMGGDLHTVEYLVGRGANVDAKGTFGGGPVWWAKLGGHTEVAYYLESIGASSY